MKAIETKILGPTLNKGQRVKAWDSAGHQVIIPWASELKPHENHEIAAWELCQKLKIPVREIISGSLKNSCVHLIRVKEDRRTCEFKGPQRRNQGS